MLIDLWHKKPKLIGSTVISLSDAVSKISSDVKTLGISVPSICQEEGIFNIFNLMGSAIGSIKLCYRLLSLGGSLMPHVSARSIMSRKEDEKTKEKDIKTDARDTLFELEDVDVESNTTLNEKHSVSEGSKHHDTETQTDVPVPTTRRTIRHTRPTYTDNTENQEAVLPITNTVCPPPLYYNFMSHAENMGENKTKGPSQKRVYDSSTNYKTGGDDVDFIYYKPELLQPDGSIGCASVCVQTEDDRTVTPVASHVDGKESRRIGTIERKINSEDLPLLNALLDELNYLRSKRGDSPEMRTDKPKKEKVIPEKIKQPFEPRECCLKATAQKSGVLRNAKKSQQVSSKKKVKFKQTSLTYGMTRTQLMRLEMNQKTKLQNPRFHDKGSEDKKGLPSHPRSRQGQEIVKNLDPVSIEDFGKTCTIFTNPDTGEGSTMVCAEVQTEDGRLFSERVEL
jgi:hypothetical protein